ncbi:MAG: YraN family protein [Muribaculaceae bacterium]|nr:YraN family protein [Muribaculaceae bacterium]
MARHNTLGKWGEAIAVDFLVARGFAIVETNWHSGHYEIDIIATRGNRMVFVEVKTRSTADYDPLDAIDSRKKNRIIRSADCYLQSLSVTYEAQYDIITIIGDQHDYTIEHIPDAFIPSVVTRRARR